MERKPLKIGDGYAVDKNWNPIIVTRKQAERITVKKQDKYTVGILWPVVCDCGEYWRGNYGGQPDLKHK